MDNGAIKSGSRGDPLGERLYRPALIRLYDQAVGGKTDALQKRLKRFAWRDNEVVEIGRLCDKALGNHDLPIVIDEHQKLHSGRHERDYGMWPECALAGDAKGQARGAHAEPRLAHGHFEHRTLARNFARECSKLVSIETGCCRDEEADT